MTTRTEATHLPDPPIARFLFADTRASILWLIVRVWVGWQWLEAGLHKLEDPQWMQTGEALRGFWQRAVAIPEAPARPLITYDWFRAFLQLLLDIDAHTWFSKVIVFGELAVGLGLIVGCLVGFAAFGGALMNWTFLMAGTTSSNPVLLPLGILLILAWKNAGYIGVDRFLLPMLGTPWKPGKLFQSGEGSGEGRQPEEPVVVGR